MKPTVGRIVHYMYGGEMFPAMITHVWTDTCVNLVIFNNGLTDNGLEVTFKRPSVTFAENHVNHTWHWPERV